MFVRMLNNKKPERVIEVPTKKNGRIDVDNKGFVHLRHPYNGHSTLAVSVIKDQFQSETVNETRKGL